MRRIFRAGQGGRMSATARNANEDNAVLREIDKQIPVIFSFTEY
jgi:hypothetical protein